MKFKIEPDSSGYFLYFKIYPMCRKTPCFSYGECQETGKIEDLDLIIPILNSISDEVERYKEYIQEVINER